MRNIYPEAVACRLAKTLLPLVGMRGQDVLETQEAAPLLAL